MPDRNKVIKGLEICYSYSPLSKCDGCPYHNLPDEQSCNDVLCLDALAILKAQEMTEPNEWIKCSDSMPEEQESIFAKFKGTDRWSPAMFERSSEDVRVVVVFSDGSRRVSHSHTIDGKWECEKSMVKRTVTHWMKNPEMPEEGQ